MSDEKSAEAPAEEAPKKKAYTYDFLAPRKGKKAGRKRGGGTKWKRIVRVKSGHSKVRLRKAAARAARSARRRAEAAKIIPVPEVHEERVGDIIGYTVSPKDSEKITPTVSPDMMENAPSPITCTKLGNCELETSSCPDLNCEVREPKKDGDTDGQKA